MKITITMDIDDRYADPAHPMGVTEEGYLGLSEALAEFGSDINLEVAA